MNQAIPTKQDILAKLIKTNVRPIMETILVKWEKNDVGATPVYDTQDTGHRFIDAHGFTVRFSPSGKVTMDMYYEAGRGDLLQIVITSTNMNQIIEQGLEAARARVLQSKLQD